MTKQEDQFEEAPSLGASMYRKPEQEPVKQKQEEVQEKQYAGSYSQKPTVKNQLIKYPDSCKISGSQTYILDLSKAEDLDQYNTFTTASLDVDSGLSIQEKEKQFYNGTWLVFITVAQIQFANLLK